MVDDQKEKDKMKKKAVKIIGGGLAGCEAAYFLCKKGVEVTMYERRPIYDDKAHETELLGELVCSNSLKSFQLSNACGLLKEEMRKMGSIMMEASDVSSIPGGNALTVDRTLFAEAMTNILLKFPNFLLIREEVTDFDDEITILATGPLTDGALYEKLGEICQSKHLSFFDASAPILAKSSFDFSKVYAKSRFSQDDDAYLNCPFTKEEYLRFVDELLKAERAHVHSIDTEYFEGCLPIEIMASRGAETLRHGMLKPFGLGTDEHPKPYAVAQLRQDTKLGDYYNLVGFQTNLTYPEQKRVFRLIPGLENAEFIRYGLMHRNSYLDAPRCLNEDLSLKNKSNVFVAGQLSGVEGYVESAATGIIAAVEALRRIEGKEHISVPKETVIGALLDYVTHATSNFAPMNANWALFPGSDKKHREITIEKALNAIESYWSRIDE